MTETVSCTVCNGNGSLMPKDKEVQSLHQPGMITSSRKCPNGWKPYGPVAHSIVQMNNILTISKDENDNNDDDNKNASEDGTKNTMRQFELLQKASQSYNIVGIAVDSIKGIVLDSSSSCLPWFPSNPGEQLCNLVGSWRILQRVGSHRWTTDDLVTAFVAMSETMHRLTPSKEKRKTLNYLDLGCGNGSVLQMVCWALLDKFDLCAIGMEARSEAVSLARRSLSFNIGPQCEENEEENRVSIIHCDFRDLIHHYDNDDNNDEKNNSRSISSSSSRDDRITKVHDKKFDLITGTPPYFQVDFTTTTTASLSTQQNDADDNTDATSLLNRVVSSAVINQGGMPTSIQSAPARCEFRGGVEAYCAAASKVLSDSGIFVVCENWLNNRRVYEGAEKSGLHIFKVIPVKGKTTRKENLFGVYLMQKKMKEGLNNNNNASNTDSLSVSPALSVRDENGRWTKEYAAILEKMSIPARHEITQT
eukprot:CAMPEP_0197830726 /NCGR_PEP_ID=MMETSP1437-20131217/7341_1 /TAXON_ID=49252 ORGANISM="Eucampia antarctica, Strain CCMP1452" /NCGR_SAMPLE_ID=MMETSP1437 /ASSEMBLY_ACC=CAM_ASM_001096 /LENGTH=476 /DNA_ID=CAMNT_0043433303 /DNA_START=17 /DNA_END=1443 /DNA_ORIENTATION=+